MKFWIFSDASAFSIILNFNLIPILDLCIFESVQFLEFHYKQIILFLAYKNKMKEQTLLFTAAVASVALVFLVANVYACNEMVCASIVSKCMLTQSCKCDLKNCSCCRECRQCLNYLYTECCSCVGMSHFLEPIGKIHDIINDVWMYSLQICVQNPMIHGMR